MVWFQVSVVFNQLKVWVAVAKHNLTWVIFLL